MSNSERILIKIPFDRSKGEPAPSFEQFGVFYKEFGKLLTKEERQNSQVYFEDGSIKMQLLLAVSQIALFDFAPTLIKALNNPQTVQHKIISTNIHSSLNGNFFKCSFIEINNEKVEPKDYSKELRQMKTIELVQYKVVLDKVLEEKSHGINGELVSAKIKKCIATVELLEDSDVFQRGKHLQFETDAEFCERNVVYIASFISKDSVNWELLNEPQIVKKLK